MALLCRAVLPQAHPYLCLVIGRYVGSAVVDDARHQHKVSSWALQVIVADMMEGMP